MKGEKDRKDERYVKYEKHTKDERNVAVRVVKAEQGRDAGGVVR